MRTMTHTRTVAVMEVSDSTYREIRELFERAGYDHALLHDGSLDMHGIAIAPKVEPEEPRAS